MAAAGYNAKENIGFAKKFDGKTLMNFLANSMWEYEEEPWTN